jgi:hypothetical protein
VSTDVSEEHIASIFRVEKLAEQETSVKAGGISCSACFFDPEDGGDMFLRKSGVEEISRARNQGESRWNFQLRLFFIP